MSVAEVREAMGRHDVGRALRRGFGRRELELTWWSGLADNFIVRLLGPRGRERVVAVSTTRQSERTASGIGPGVPVTRLRGAFPDARCRTLFPVGGGMLIGTEYVVDAGNGRATAFVRGKWEGDAAHRVRADARTIVEVIVRARSARPPAVEQRC